MLTSLCYCFYSDFIFADLPYLTHYVNYSIEKSKMSTKAWPFQKRRILVLVIREDDFLSSDFGNVSQFCSEFTEISYKRHSCSTYIMLVAFRERARLKIYSLEKPAWPQNYDFNKCCFFDGFICNIMKNIQIKWK